MKGKTAGIFRRILPILLRPEVFFLLVAFLLIQLWFSKNILFGGTEAGVPTLYPGKILDQIRWTWWEALGSGVSIPTASASIPFYAFLTLLERFGVGAILLQKILFFIIIYLQGFGASLVFKTIIPKQSRLPILAGLFYIFNPYMMTQIWHRFIYANFILSAVLPILVYFYMKLLEKGKPKFILFFLITSFLASYMYSSIAPVITIWLSIFVLCSVAVILNRRDIKQISKITIQTFILFIFWMLTNLWWINPLLNIKDSFSVFSLKGNVNTLIALNERSSINNVIRGINTYNLFIEADWGEEYSSFLFQSLSWIPMLFILFGLITRINSSKIWYVISFFLVGIFVAKGANEPLGNFTAWIYSNLFFLGTVRNPFEKLGLMIILPYSILATIGVYNFWNFYRNIIVKVLVIILVMGAAVYVWPMWSDKLFGSEKYPPYFTLPDNYPKVSAFLAEQLKSDNGKILHLPISEGDSATYKWKYIYNGVELSWHLFPGSSISRLLYTSFIDQQLLDTAQIFHTNDYSLQRQVLFNFGVKYIVLNKDLDWYSRSIDNPEFVEKILGYSPDLKMIMESGNLKVYKFIAKTSPEITSAGNMTLISTKKNAGILDFTPVNPKEGVFLQITKGQQIPKEVLQNEVIFPSRVLNETDSDKNFDAIIPKPFIKHLPSAFYYPLILLKEKIEFLLTPNYQKTMKLVFLTQKRLMESQLLEEQRSKRVFIKSIKEYINSLNQTIAAIKKLGEGEFDATDKIIIRIATKEEKEILETLVTSTSDKDTKTLIEDSIKAIIAFRKEQGFEAYYPYSEPGPYTNIYQFLVPEKSKFELILNIPNPRLYDIEINKKLNIFLDGQFKEVIPSKRNDTNLFSLGEIVLDAGVHEIGLLAASNTHLITTTDFINKNGVVDLEEEVNNLIKINTLDKESWIEYSIPNYDSSKTYLMEFYYRQVKGAPPQIQFWQDSDRLVSKKEPKITRNLENNFYDFDWKYVVLSISSDNNAPIRLGRHTTKPVIRSSIPLGRHTTKPVIRLLVPFWNNCEIRDYKKLKLCKDPQFRSTYNRQSIVEIRDLKITEFFTGNVLLNRRFNNVISPSIINFKKISPVEYWVESDTKSRYQYIILNEGFQSGWKLILDSKNPQTINEDHHFITNGYANGWLIDKSGKISFKIKFLPQEYLYKGILISMTAYIIIVILVINQN